ncbi:MAG: hypothetical protein H8D67_14785 [Deltaproteobacteria bacterium]|nr:hypothetical protein [Deltaproteobacteria bacterium]
MPYKAAATLEDYPERSQDRPPGGWVAEHQRQTLEKAIGSQLMGYLEERQQLDRIDAELIGLRHRISALFLEREKIHLGKEDDDAEQSKSIQNGTGPLKGG